MTKDNCIICQIIDGKIPSKKIYEDDEVIAILDMNGANPGHAFVMPKEHFPIIEQVPDYLLGKVFGISNHISSAVFESLQIQGTNIFVANGVSAGQTIAHFMVQVIPRKDNDGINLTWDPKQLNEEEMSTVELKIKDAAKNVGYFEKAPKQTVSRNNKEIDELVEDEEDIMVSNLKRVP